MDLILVLNIHSMVHGHAQMVIFKIMMEFLQIIMLNGLLSIIKFIFDIYYNISTQIYNS